MKKIITLLLFVNSFIFASNIQKNWTIVLSSTKNLENAHTFIKNNIVNHSKELFIIKKNKRYRTTYGSYPSRVEVLKEYKLLPLSLRKSGAYILKSKYNLNDSQNIKEITKIDIKIEKNTTIKKVSNQKKLQNSAKIISIHTKDLEKYIETTKLTTTKEVAKENNTPSLYNLTLGLKYSRFNQTGEFHAGNNGSNTTYNDLNIYSSNTFIPSVELSRGNHKIHSSYLTNSVNEDTTISDAMTLNDYTYQANDKITTNLETKWLQTGYQYQFNNVSLGADIHNYTNTIDVSNTSNKTHIKYDYLFPSVTLDMKHNINKNQINYGLSYGKSSNIQYTHQYFSYLMPFSFIDFAIGYELRQLDIKDGTYTNDSKFHGINFELKKTF